ncbi:DM13 domain-containing protein [Actinomadura sp. NPDC047616]|uniref:DM13 domain-containing protein n=1 Tax=Actinomadura sp. NPDC047616 TaxID=3155914 RepID=UPI0033E10A2F
MGTLLRRPVVWVVGGVLVVGAAVGLALFQPWLLFVDEEVNEAGPAVVSSPGAAATPTATGQAQGQDVGPRVLASGAFISHEHETSGMVKVIRLADGRRVLRLEELDTSNGPDLRVWLSDQPVKGGTAGWGVFDDGAYVELGKLKGNKGDQNYAIPADADLDELTSVSIWCKRFKVSFGAAELRA